MSLKTNASKAIACANIALIKYWGKRDTALNLPAVGSISITLDALQTETCLRFREDLEQDKLTINNQIASEKQRSRVTKFLDIVRVRENINQFAEVSSINNFPTGAGLASSASAFAALTLAATDALGMMISKKEQSKLARKGSGSAARSIFGGFVEMLAGQDPAGKDAFAIQLAPASYWDLRVLILITSAEEKSTGSTEAMNLTAMTSPYYENWITDSIHDLNEMRTAIRSKDFEKLGELAEYNALKMHALTLSSRPPIIYWNHTTIDLIHHIQALRKRGIPAYFTIDAGPQVKVITLPAHVSSLKSEFKSVFGIKEIVESALGPDATVIGVE